MPDENIVSDSLSLAVDFPQVATAEWEAAIRADLKGADYDKKLIWHTEEGIAVRPYYRAEDIAPPFPSLGSGHTWEIAEAIPEGPGVVRADTLHEEGAHAVLELQGAMAMAAEKLEQLPQHQGAKDLELVFAIGPYYFMEIAKFRAVRVLWMDLLARLGATASVRIAAVTPLRNKSTCDRYTNLLRVTTEAMSAVLGGADRVIIQPYGFDPHLALNVQRILREEVHLDAVADVAGGSYYIESLTAMLVREARRPAGSLTAAIAESRAAREKAVSSRRRTLVGVNNYPNPDEKVSEIEPAGSHTPASDGRLAAPFERIRARTAGIAREMGRYPRVLLLERGDPKMRSARANFCLNFFGCAGFDIVQSGELAPADLIILCSSDAEYLALAREICPQASAPVLVAGNPKDQIEALKAAGVEGFVHIQSDAVQTLTEWQNRIAGGKQ